MYSTTQQHDSRLLSLDFYRGLTMFLLIAEFSLLFEHLTSPQLEGTWLYALGSQFHHVKWEGLHFWDLIQPFFMFIVGVAMPFSFAKRKARGDRYQDIRNHAFRRAFLLLLLGWALYCIDPGKIVFRFQNVLAQLSVTYILAFLIMRKSARIQIICSLFLLLLTEILYRNFWIPGFDQAWIPGKNFGAWLNILISGSEDGGHWAMFNAIPTTAHTIWGVVAGQWLLSDKAQGDKLKLLLVSSTIALVIGYGLSFYTPIIKRISTTSFVIVSGGWSLWALAMSYWLIDMKRFRKYVWIFAIIGMNPLFIYLFAHVGGAELIRKILLPFSNFIFQWMGALGAQMMLSLVVLGVLWYICYWLHKRKIYIRI